MGIKMVLVGLGMVTVLSGCGTSNSVSNHAEHPALAQGGHSVSDPSASVSPQVYNVCSDIYDKVSKAQKGEGSADGIDVQLESIDTIGSKSSDKSPNGILYADTASVVGIQDAINGEGAPSSSASLLAKALATLKVDLDKYKPVSS